jgi:hypothetical protein
MHPFSEQAAIPLMPQSMSKIARSDTAYLAIILFFLQSMILITPAAVPIQRISSLELLGINCHTSALI